MVPKRLGRLPERCGRGGLRVFEARSFRARLLGLALLDGIPADCALLIPRCSSVHTYGMRFPIDLAFLDEGGGVIRLVEAVPPRRHVRCRGAAAVLEWRSDRASAR